MSVLTTVLLIQLTNEAFCILQSFILSSIGSGGGCIHYSGGGGGGSGGGGCSSGGSSGSSGGSDGGGGGGIHGSDNGSKFTVLMSHI